MRPVSDQGGDQTQTRRKASVREAADALGISVEAVRGRIKRGTISHEKAPDGGVYVWLDADQTHDQTQPDDDQDANRPSDQTALVEALQSEISHLREVAQRRDERHAEEILRRDHIIAAALERIPAIESSGGLGSAATEADPPPPHPDVQGRETSTQRPTDSAGEIRPAAKRSWWRRLFGG
jgi:hypothetical protein